MLLAAQPVGLFGRKQLRDRAVGPGETRGGARVARPFLPGADRHQSGLAEHHDFAHVVVGRADQIDERERLRPFAHRLGAGARLAGPAAGQDQPIDPIARRRPLLGPRPQRPVVKQLVDFLAAEPRQKPGSLGRREREQIADLADHRRVAGRAAPPAPAARRARFLTGLRASAHASALGDGIMRAAMALSLARSRSRACSS
jgi:hypothetical protein